MLQAGLKMAAIIPLARLLQTTWLILTKFASKGFSCHKPINDEILGAKGQEACFFLSITPDRIDRQVQLVSFGTG